jgi:DMSO/TMAO reductase YedYZ heme-binding membrane subunit
MEKKNDVDNQKVMPKRLTDYGGAAAIAILLWSLVTYYHFVRRHIWNPFSSHELNFLLLANKGLALTAVLMISLSVLLGPLARWSSFCRKRVGYRKQIGLLGAMLAGLHVIVSLLMLPEQFPLIWYGEHLPALGMGIAALLTLLVISVHSTESAPRRIGYRRWKTIQRLVYSTLLFAMAHYMLMGKPANWVRWSQTMETPLPPGTLVVTVVVVLVLIARLIAMLPKRREQEQ